MRIDNVQIETYGEKNGLFLDYSLGNFQLTYGANEAGKSTLLSFIRNIFFDLASKAGADVDPPFGIPAEVGGSLAFTLSNGRAGSVFRRWNRQQNKQVEFDGRVETKVLTSEEFVPRVLGCDRDFFTNHFGFSSLDLTRGGAALGRNEIARFLFGASIGDYERVEQLQKDLEKRVQELFAKKKTASPKKFRIDKAVVEIADVSKRIKETENKSSSYRSKQDELERLTKEREEAFAQRAAVAQERDRLKTLVDARDKFLDFHKALDELTKRRARAQFEDAERFSQQDESEYAEIESQIRETQRTVDELKRSLDESLREIDLIDVATLNAICGKAKEINQIGDLLNEYNKIVAARPKTLETLDDQRQTLLRDLDAFFSRDEGETDDETLARARNEALNSLQIEEIKRNETKEEEIDRQLRAAETKLRVAVGDLEAARTTCAERSRELVDEFGEEDRSAQRKRVDGARAQIPTVRDALRDLRTLLQAYDTSAAEARRHAAELAIQANDGAEPEEDFDVFLRRFVEPAQFNTIKAKRDEIARERDEVERALVSLEEDLEDVRVDDSNVLGRRDASEAELTRLIEELKMRWALIARDWLGSDALEPAGRVELASQFNRTLDLIEPALKTFGAASKELGEYEFRDAQFKSKLAARELALNKLETINARLSSVEDEARELWRKFGFEKCAAWDVDATANWLEKWRLWQTADLASAANRRSLYDLARDKRRTLEGVFDAFKPWREPDDSELASLSLFDDAANASPRALVDAISSLADYADKVRLDVESATERYDALTKERDAAASRAQDSEEKVAQYEKELATQRELASVVAARATSFCDGKSLRVNLDAERPLRSLLDAAQLWDAWRLRAEEYERATAKAARDEAFIAEYESDVASIFASVLQRDSGGTAVDAQALKDALTNALPENGRYANLCKNRDVDSKRFKEKRSELEERRNDARTRRAAFGIDSDEEFAAFREEAREYRTLLARWIERRGVLEAALGVASKSEAWKRYFDEWESNDESTIIARRDEAEKTVAELDGEIGELNQKIGALGVELKGMSESVGNSAHQAKRRELVASLRGYVDEYVPLKLALIALEKSTQRFEAERIPAILSYAQDLFSRITDGRYVAIQSRKTKGEGTEYVALDDCGAGKRVQELSSGTREQLYLALKLALIRAYAENSEPLPVLIDDALVNSDDQRARRIMKVLAEFASDRQQVVLFSHSLATRDAFAEIVGEEKIVELKGARG